jgi:hypothetical protein
VAYHTFKHVSAAGGGGRGRRGGELAGAPVQQPRPTSLPVLTLSPLKTHLIPPPPPPPQVLDLDISFHLDRKTGRLSRILERGEAGGWRWGPGDAQAWACAQGQAAGGPSNRQAGKGPGSTQLQRASDPTLARLPPTQKGTRSVQMLYRAMLFTFAPTAVELVFVLAVLATQFSPITAGLVAATFVVYVTWTLAMTQVGVGVCGVCVWGGGRGLRLGGLFFCAPRAFGVQGLPSRRLIAVTKKNWSPASCQARTHASHPWALARRWRWRCASASTSWTT